MSDNFGNLLEQFIVPLARNGIRHLVSGSVASIFYGEPRATLDVDAAIVLHTSQIPLLEACFPAAEYYLPPSEVIFIELTRPSQGHFNVIHHASGYKADFYPSRNHPYFQWALAHAVLLDLDGVSIQIAPPEYVILWKLEFLRLSREDKHIRDIQGMLRVSAGRIDLAILNQAIEETGLQEIWKSISE